MAVVPQAKKNLATSTVATAPSPADSGDTLVVAAGEGARFPTTFPFDLTCWPDGQVPTPANAEIVKVTNRSTDTLTITRAQGGTTAKSIAVGWRVAQTITVNAMDEAMRSLVPYNVILDGADPTGSVASTSLINAALVACDAAGGGVVAVPPGDYLQDGGITIPDTCLLWAPGGPLGTRLFWSSSLGAGVYAVTTEDIGNNTEREPAIIGFELDGPGDEGAAYGTAPTDMHGIKLNSNGLAKDCWVHGFNRGIEWYGNHQRTFECRVNANYDGGFFGNGATFGDQDIRGSRFVGNKRAAWGVGGAGMADGITSVGNHLGFCPYGIYKEAGTNNNILTGSTLTDTAFEAIGNSAIYDAGGDGAVEGNTFMNGAGGGGWWNASYKIAANPADYYVVCTNFNYNDIFGTGWFCKAGAVAVFDCTNLNGNVFHNASAVIANVVADGKRFVSDTTTCYGTTLYGDRNRRCLMMKYGGGAGAATRYDVLYFKTYLGGPGLGCGKQGSDLPVGVAQWAVPSDNYWVAVCVEGETDVNCSQGQTNGTWYAQADTTNRGKVYLTSDPGAARIIGHAESGTTNGVAHCYLSMNASGLAATTKTFRTVHTFAIKGTLTGADSTPGFFVSKTAGQTVNIVKARYKIASGTNVTFKIQKNGGDLTGYGTTGAPLTATSTAAETASTQALADNDDIDLVLVGVSGSPVDLQVTVVLEHTV